MNNKASNNKTIHLPVTNVSNKKKAYKSKSSHLNFIGEEKYKTKHLFLFVINVSLNQIIGSSDLFIYLFFLAHLTYLFQINLINLNYCHRWIVLRYWYG